MLFALWLGQLRMRRTVGAFRLCWLEAVALAFFRELHMRARRSKQQGLRALRDEADVSAALRADRALYTTAHYCVVRWMLLPGATALSSWIAYAGTRVRHRSLLAVARASTRRRLLAAVVGGWCDWMWHEQLMRSVRSEMKPERGDAARTSAANRLLRGGATLQLPLAEVAPRLNWSREASTPPPSRERCAAASACTPPYSTPSRNWSSQDSARTPCSGAAPPSVPALWEHEWQTDLSASLLPTTPLTGLSGGCSRGPSSEHFTANSPM